MSWTEVGWVAVEEDEDVYVVTLAEAEDEGPALFLMCDVHEPDEQDVTLGVDTYSLVTETDATHYGGVKKVVLDDPHLTLHLTGDAAKALGLPAVVELTLLVDTDDVDALRQGLDWVLSYGDPDERPELDLGSAGTA